MAYTQLAPTALPGGRYSFSPKMVVRGIGPFTELSIMAIPGMIHSFLAKSPYVPIVEPLPKPGGGQGGSMGLRRRRRLVSRDDKDIREILMMIMRYLN